MARGARAATLLRAVALLGLIVLAFLLPGLAPPAPASSARPTVVARAGHATPLLAERRAGQPFVEEDRELEEEDVRALEAIARVTLHNDPVSSTLLAAADERPACLVRLLAFPIRGPPSA